ncbi:MAG: hypothetical protein K1V89_00085, partial [Muribaculaceae bacterium]
MLITSFEQLTECIKASGKKRRIAVANPSDHCSIEALEMALDADIAELILVGDLSIKQITAPPRPRSIGYGVCW